MTMGCCEIWSLCVAIIMAMPVNAATQPLNMVTTPNTTKPGCIRQCGNITVPYPFGIGMNSGCSLNMNFEILCASSFDPPKAFLPMIKQGRNATNVEVLDITDTQIRLRNEFVAYHCYDSSGNQTTGTYFDSTDTVTMDYYFCRGCGQPFRLSATANRLTVVGCNDEVNLIVNDDHDFFDGRQATNLCPTNCSSGHEQVVAGPCNGHGCCETTIPVPDSPSKFFQLSLDFGPITNHTFIASWNPCRYDFVGERGSFSFRGLRDLNGSYKNFMDRIRNEVPLVLDWVAVDGVSCTQAKKHKSTYLCKQPNTVCDDSDPVLGGYRCLCDKGYEGNPYLSPGCTDTNECKGKHDCSSHCVNTPGSYTCSCPSGYSGDGRKHGTGCKPPFLKVQVALGASFGFLLLIVGVSGVLLIVREKRLMKRRNKCFQQNGGFLLKQLLPSDYVQSTKIFTGKELMTATKNFSEENILGTGGYGTVYKGLLANNQVVAIKKSKIADESQIEQFINELVVLTRINHPYVVNLLGCCLETEVPLLVYEFISNGTLYEWIHARGNTSCLSLSNCLRIAMEAAKALAYLHSVPIIHRDIKSTNILLDDNYTAKIADFGIARLIPMDKTRLDTLVQGTLGYLDPEYFFSSQLTNKSDVYSFGVVLAELFTREAPLLDEKYANERYLSMYFVESMKEGRLLEIMPDQLVKEASQDQLTILGKLIQSCLSVRGQDRPTMKKVATVLEDLCKLQEQVRY